MANALPLFHLYGDPPDDQAFDFIHVETIPSRSSVHDWTIRAHRHRNLFQILLIERGGGEMIYEAAKLPFAAPAAILVPAAVAHGFRFEPGTEGWVMSFTEDAAFALADRSGEALSRLRALAAHPIIPMAGEADRTRLSDLCAELFEEGSLAREGYRMAMRSLLALIAVTVARLAASRARTGAITLQPADATVAQLRTLVDEYFRREHQLGFYAEKLGMRPAQRSRQTRHRRDRRSPDSSAAAHRSQARARLHHAADPGHCRGARFFRPLALRPLLPQADRHHAARVPRPARVTPVARSDAMKQSRRFRTPD
jgi:AraC family transcriptional regulator, transcriptional activator of pobA